MRDLISKSKNYILEKLNITDIEEYILISIEHQELNIIDNMQVIASYKISTSKYGVGNVNDSFQTPLGIHHIAKKIGDRLKKNTILKGRKIVFDGITTDDLNSFQYTDFKKKHFSKNEDVITSRIMWLKGNENGVNLGGDVDTYSRYIYIHGTIHEDKIGDKDSHGCIRMNNDDVIKLFDYVKVNMIVHIV
tara:strand:- start:490 stop:1062 length:573 start_codon:yes stop_codon:yes gene_type:complete